MKYFFTLTLIFINITFVYADNKTLYPYKINIQELNAKTLTLTYKGNAIRGKKIITDRRVNCVSCHQVPIPEEKFQGNFGPSLIDIGKRYTKDEIRLRVINSKILNPESIMPSYFVKIEYERTPAKLLRKTILSFKEVEDIVEYLYSLK